MKTISFILKYSSLFCVFFALVSIMGAVDELDNAINNDDVRWMMWEFLWWLKINVNLVITPLVAAWLLDKLAWLFDDFLVEE